MIEIAVQSDGWPAEDWRSTVNSASLAAIAVTPYASIVTAATAIEVAIRLTSDAEVQALNRDYRSKDAPTNVLSFPMLERGELEALCSRAGGSPSHDQSGFPLSREYLLGDIILAYETCAREAAAKNITLEAHAQHLIIHGTLHLLGYDHISDEDAQVMESLERRIMALIGLHDPYDDEDD